MSSIARRPSAPVTPSTGIHGLRATRVALVTMLVVYLALLVWVVLWKFELPWVGTPAHRTIKLVPFVGTSEFGPSQPPEVVANVVLFVPFGLYLGILLPARRWPLAVLAFAATSVGLETAQYVFAVGSSDVSDVISNTAGGVLGLASIAVARAWFPAKASTIAARAAMLLTVLAVMGSLLIAASPLRLAPADAGPLGRALHRELPHHP
jgi:glycopeptide antibiotics resistance protein